MNNDLMLSVDELLKDTNIDEMWNKFFSEVNFDNDFISSLENFLWADLERQNYADYNQNDFEDMMSDYDEINDQIEERSQKIDNIDKVLREKGDSLGDYQRELFEKARAQLISERNSLKRKRNVNSKFFKEHKALIDESKASLENVALMAGNLKSVLAGNFEKLRAGLLNDSEKKRDKVLDDKKQFELMMENLNKNVNYWYNTFRNYESQFGSLNPQTKSALESYNKSVSELNTTKANYKGYVDSLNKLDVDLINYIQFLKDLSFDKFYDKLADNNFNLFYTNVDNKKLNPTPSPTPSPSPVPEPKPEGMETEPEREGMETEPEREGMETEPEREEKKIESEENYDDIVLKAIEEAKRRQEEAEEANKDYNLTSREGLEEEEKWKKAYEEPKSEEKKAEPEPEKKKPDTGDNMFDDYMKNQEEMYKRGPIKTTYGTVPKFTKDAFDQFDRMFEDEKKKGDKPIDKHPEIKLSFKGLDELEEKKDTKRDSFQVSSNEVINSMNNPVAGSSLLFGINNFLTADSNRKQHKHSAIVTKIKEIPEHLIDKVKSLKPVSKSKNILNRMKNYVSEKKDNIKYRIGHFNAIGEYNKLIDLSNEGRLAYEYNNNKDYYENIFANLYNYVSTVSTDRTITSKDLDSLYNEAKKWSNGKGM